MRVTDPDGVEWEVSRQWLHVRRWRAPRPGLGNKQEDDDDRERRKRVGLPLLLLLAGFVFAVGGLVIRIVLRRPWLVRARSERGELEWRVRGTIGSRRAIHQVARALERGDRSAMPKGGERLLPESPLQQFR